MPVIASKRRRPQSLGYNSWTSIHFPTVTLGASQAYTAIQSSCALFLNTKIVGLVALLTGTVAETCDINVILGTGTASAGLQAVGTVTIGGTPTTGDTVTATIGGTAVAFSSITTSVTTLAQIASGLAAAINANATANASVYAYARGAVCVIVAITPGTAGNSITLTAAETGGHTTATASGADLAGGIAGATSLAPPDNTLVGTVPPTVAAAGNCLFAAHLPVLMTANTVTTYYPTQEVNGAANPSTYDAIWPAGGELTLRTVTPASTTGTLDVWLWGVPVDIHPMSPESSNQGFVPSATTL